MGFIAVIDTETNWQDEVMSVGVAVADAEILEPVAFRYYILEPEIRIGGMYTGALHLVTEQDTIRCSRREAMKDLNAWLETMGAEKLFAYNARFDFAHLPELRRFVWYDIMRIAAYRQYNRCIPQDAPCCSTGRLKRHYGVEPITQLLTADPGYAETHNALFDAVDELRIMRLLQLPIAQYEHARI